MDIWTIFKKKAAHHDSKKGRFEEQTYRFETPMSKQCLFLQTCYFLIRNKLSCIFHLNICYFKAYSRTRALWDNGASSRGPLHPRYIKKLVYFSFIKNQPMANEFPWRAFPENSGVPFIDCSVCSYFSISSKLSRTGIFAWLWAALIRNLSIQQ